MNAIGIQQDFIRHIRNILPRHLSLVDEIADLLNISNDSAYRRIRGEKQISFEELQILCSHYKVSLDRFLHLQTDAILFSGRIDTKSETMFEDYLKNLLTQIRLINNYDQKHLFVLMKDIPPFVHFQILNLQFSNSIFG